MDISIYLVELLRLHDCVIVPDLGGFVTNYRPAEMDLAGNRFNPPVKEVIFTGKLTKNDGLLVNYISETEGVGYMEARQIISEFVDEIWSKLENGDSITFQNLGYLKFDKNEKLIFESEIHDNFLLQAYGMEGFQFPQLEWREIIPSKRIFADRPSTRPVLSSRKVKALAIGIPILLALVFVPASKYPWNSHSVADLQTSGTADLSLNSSVTPLSNVHVDPVFAGKPEVLKIDSVKLIPVQAKISPTVSVKSNERYRVIGGCFRLRENAEKFLGNLQKDGYKSELKVLPNGTFLVIVQSYSDKKEALLALNTLRQSDPKAGYWISGN